MTTAGGDFVPLVLEIRPVPLRAGEDWARYKARVEERFSLVRERAEFLLSLPLQPLIAANALYGQVTEQQIHHIRQGALGCSVRRISWSPEVRSEQITDIAKQIGVAPFRSIHGELTGKDVRVAVLDSGIDLHHPFLEVADSTSTCPESWDIPGRHGTFCAGVIAARHFQYTGIAPEVELLNIKIARGDGRTTPAYLAKGVDEALDRYSDVISISFGLNQSWHGWTCFAGNCILCRAVDNAVCCGAVVVAAAGNQHRGVGTDRSNRSRTELLCPGQAREAITVGATEKSPSSEIYFLSSRGPTMYGLQKPDLVAPGVDVISTVPTPHRDGGDSFLLFSSGSGTSVAAAVVAGAVALLIEKRNRAEEVWTPREIRKELLTRYVRRLDNTPPEATGAGCLDLSRLS